MGSATTGLAATVLSQNAGSDLILTQNGVAAFTTVNAGAVANTLYLKAGNVGIGTLCTWKSHVDSYSQRIIHYLGCCGANG